MGGSTTTQKTQIDPHLARESKKAMDLAKLVAQLPFSPNLGVSIAGFTPQQLAAQDTANVRSAAFGLPSSAQSAAQVMPPTQTSPSGIQGYSTAADYQGMRDASMTPELQRYIEQFFLDPNNPGVNPVQQRRQGGGKGSQSSPQSLINTDSGRSDYIYTPFDQPAHTGNGLFGNGGFLGTGLGARSESSGGTGGGK
jgi:hypothetical protein